MRIDPPSGGNSPYRSTDAPHVAAVPEETVTLMSSRRVVMAAGLLFVLLVSPRLAGAFGILQIDRKSEVRLGGEIDRWFHAHHKWSNNGSWHERLDRIGERLVEAADPEQRYIWRFQITTDGYKSMLSSCAGYVYASKGIMEMDFTDDELAGCVAHEMGHIMKQHVAKSYAAEYQALVFDEAVVDRAVEDLKANRNGQAGPFKIFTYGRAKMERDFEREADILGVRYCAKAGFEPAAHATALRKLLGPGRSNYRIQEILIMTHPPSQERIDRIEAEARRIKGE